MDSVFNSFNKNNLTNVFGGKQCNEVFWGANILSVWERKTKKTKKQKKVITCPRSTAHVAVLVSIGSLSDYDDDHNDDFKKKIGLMIKTTALHGHHAF